MKVILLNWLIYSFVFCSFPRSYHVTNVPPKSVEDYLQVTNEIISKSQSYNNFMNNFRDNWQSPFAYLLQRGYIPTEDAKPSELSRDIITEMKKQYTHDINEAANFNDEVDYDIVSLQDSCNDRRSVDVVKSSVGKAENSVPDNGRSSLNETLPTQRTTSAINSNNRLNANVASSGLSGCGSNAVPMRFTTEKCGLYKADRIDESEFYDFYDNVTECYYYNDDAMINAPDANDASNSAGTVRKDDQRKLEPSSKQETSIPQGNAPEMLPKHESKVPQTLSKYDSNVLEVLPKHAPKAPQSSSRCGSNAPEIFPKTELKTPEVFAKPDENLSEGSGKYVPKTSQLMSTPQMLLRQNILPQSLSNQENTLSQPPLKNQNSMSQIWPKYDISVPQMSVSKTFPEHQATSSQMYSKDERGMTSKYDPKSKYEVPGTCVCRYAPSNAQNQDPAYQANLFEGQYPLFLRPDGTFDNKFQNTVKDKNVLVTSQAALDLAQKVAENTVQKYSKYQYPKRTFAPTNSSEPKTKRTQNTKDVNNVALKSSQHSYDAFPLGYYPPMGWLNYKKPYERQNGPWHLIDTTRTSDSSAATHTPLKQTTGFQNLPIFPGWNNGQTYQAPFNGIQNTPILPGWASPSAQPTAYQSVPQISNLPSTRCIFPNMPISESGNAGTLPQSEVNLDQKDPMQANAFPSNKSTESSMIQALHPNHSHPKIDDLQQNSLKYPYPLNIEKDKKLLQQPQVNGVSKDNSVDATSQNLAEVIKQIENEMNPVGNTKCYVPSNSEPMLDPKNLYSSNADDKPESYIALNALYVVNKKDDRSKGQNFSLSSGKNITALNTAQQNSPPENTALESIKPSKTHLNIAYSTPNKDDIGLNVDQNINQSGLWNVPKYDESLEGNANRLRRKDKGKSLSDFENRKPKISDVRNFHDSKIHFSDSKFKSDSNKEIAKNQGSKISFSVNYGYQKKPNERLKNFDDIETELSDSIDSENYSEKAESMKINETDRKKPKNSKTNIKIDNNGIDYGKLKDSNSKKNFDNSKSKGSTIKTNKMTSAEDLLKSGNSKLTKVNKSLWGNNFKSGSLKVLDETDDKPVFRNMNLTSFNVGLFPTNTGSSSPSHRKTSNKDFENPKANSQPWDNLFKSLKSIQSKKVDETDEADFEPSYKDIKSQNFNISSSSSKTGSGSLSSKKFSSNNYGSFKKFPFPFSEKPGSLHMNKSLSGPQVKSSLDSPFKSPFYRTFGNKQLSSGMSGSYGSKPLSSSYLSKPDFGNSNTSSDSSDPYDSASDYEGLSSSDSGSWGSSKSAISYGKTGPLDSSSVYNSVNSAECSSSGMSCGSSSCKSGKNRRPVYYPSQKILNYYRTKNLKADNLGSTGYGKSTSTKCRDIRDSLQVQEQSTSGTKIHKKLLSEYDNLRPQTKLNTPQCEFGTY